MTEFGHSPLLSRKKLSDLGFAVSPCHPSSLAMKAIEVGLGVLADEESQQSILDLMQTREELYDLLDYDPHTPDQDSTA